MAGMVYLVGAGPGDYRLVSIKAVDCLKKADVVVYDRLADDRILKWAPEEAEYIYVGKASSHHTMKQGDINQLLVDKAKEGKTVVRLKGGDPFVFGRGGEEGILLEENGIPFEIVPGITSAISVPAYAGIPVTHRAVATSFAVITGHEDPTKGQSNMRWDKLATGVDTLVFLMGVANLPHHAGTHQQRPPGRYAGCRDPLGHEAGAEGPHHDGGQGCRGCEAHGSETAGHFHCRRGREAPGQAAVV